MGFYSKPDVISYCFFLALHLQNQNHERLQINANCCIYVVIALLTVIAPGQGNPTAVLPLFGSILLHWSFQQQPVLAT